MPGGNLYALWKTTKLHRSAQRDMAMHEARSVPVNVLSKRKETSADIDMHMQGYCWGLALMAMRNALHSMDVMLTAVCVHVCVYVCMYI